jgi:hypothetical protein
MDHIRECRMERPAHRRDDRAADLIADGVLPAKVLGLAPRGHQREPPPQGRVPLQSQDAFPSSKFSIDQNRHGIGKSQPIRTDSKRETTAHLQGQDAGLRGARQRRRQHRVRRRPAARVTGQGGSSTIRVNRELCQPRSPCNGSQRHGRRTSCHAATTMTGNRLCDACCLLATTQGGGCVMMDGRLCTHSWLRRWLVPLVCIVPTPLAAAPPARAPARAFPSSIS